MNNLTTLNVACAINAVEFKEPAHLVLVGQNDLSRFHQHEEAFLRQLGVIPDGQPLNGIIHENPMALVTAAPSSPSSAPPSSAPGVACIYQHITEGGCKCTYRKKCFKVTVPLDGGQIASLLTCGGGDSFTLRIDHVVEMLIGPQALRRLILDPGKFSCDIDLDGRPTSGIIPLLDLDLLNMNTWHMQTWAHISEGSCKCKYLPVSSIEVDVSNLRL